jgi:hypothetical protein
MIRPSCRSAAPFSATIGPFCMSSTANSGSRRLRSLVALGTPVVQPGRICTVMVQFRGERVDSVAVAGAESGFLTAELHMP